MYPINLPESTRRIATLEGGSTARIVRMRLYYIPQDEKSYIQQSYRVSVA